MSGWITTILNSIQDWIRFEVLDRSDAVITAPRTMASATFAFPELTTVGRRLWINTSDGALYGPFTVAQRVNSSTITIAEDWPTDLISYVNLGGVCTWRLQTWFAAQLRRMEFMTMDPGTRMITNPAATDMPLLVGGPVVGEHAIRQHSNLQIEMTLQMHFEIWTPGQYIDQLTDLMGELVDLLLAGRINRAGNSNRPFRMTDDTTGYQRAELGPVELRRAADTDANGVLKNIRHVGKLDLSCMVLRRQPS